MTKKDDKKSGKRLGYSDAEKAAKRAGEECEGAAILFNRAGASSKRRDTCRAPRQKGLGMDCENGDY